MIRPLVLGPEERARAEEILSFARDHVYRPGPGAQPPGLDARHVALFQVGFRCVFSFTESEGALWRHLSISVDGDHYPNEAAVEMLGQLFGFRGGLTSWVGRADEHDRCVIVAQQADAPPHAEARRATG